MSYQNLMESFSPLTGHTRKKRGLPLERVALENMDTLLGL